MRREGAAAAALLAAVACGSGTADPEYGYEAAAIVYGTVSTAAGEPVTQVDVRVFVVAGEACDGRAMTTAPSVVTDGSGFYRGRFTALAEGPFEGCVDVQVRPAAGSGITQQSVRGGTVRFSADAPFDSLRVDITYSAAAASRRLPP